MRFNQKPFRRPVKESIDNQQCAVADMFCQGLTDILKSIKESLTKTHSCFFAMNTFRHEKTGVCEIKPAAVRSQSEERQNYLDAEGREAAKAVTR